MTLEHSHDPAAISARLADGSKPSYVRDFVYGGIDGAITTFAIVAGVVGAALSANVILILGLANLLADGFSMAASNYSGTKTVVDNVERVREVEARHVRVDPDGEREEVRQILAQSGLAGSTLDRAVEAVTADRQRWIDFMVAEEYGLGATNPSPLRAGIATFSAFAICGAVPLLPFLVDIADPLAVSIAMTGIVFVAIGAAKSRWSPTAWWRSGLETLLIGGTAAGLAYLTGYLLRTIWDVSV